MERFCSEMEWIAIRHDNREVATAPDAPTQFKEILLHAPGSRWKVHSEQDDVHEALRLSLAHTGPMVAPRAWKKRGGPIKMLLKNGLLHEFPSHFPY